MTTTTTTLALPELSSRRAYRAAQREPGLMHYLARAVSASLLTLTLALAAAVIAIPAAVGGSALTVLTQSMEPGLPPGSLIVIRPTPVEDIAIGDVITYQIRSGEEAVVTHRVISKTFADGEVTFITQGDNNNVPDPEPVREVQVRGTLWYSLPLLGWVNTLFSGANRDIAVAVGVGALFLYAAAMVVGATRDRRRHPDATGAAAESERDTESDTESDAESEAAAEPATPYDRTHRARRSRSRRAARQRRARRSTTRGARRDNVRG